MTKTLKRHLKEGNEVELRAHHAGNGSENGMSQHPSPSPSAQNRYRYDWIRYFDALDMSRNIILDGTHDC